MPVTKQEGNFIPTITQQSFTDGLKVAFTAAGYGAVYAEFDETDTKNLVYQVVNNVNKLYGTVYLHIKISSQLELGQKLHTAFDTTTNTGLNTVDYNLSNNFYAESTLRWIALNNGSEFRWVFLYQGSQWVCLGMMRPLGMPTYWDENIAPYAIVSDVSYAPLQNFFLSDVSPYTNNNYIQSNWLEPVISSNRNPFNSQIEIVTRFLFSPNSKQGMFGMSSSLLALATDDELTIGDFIALPDGSEYCAVAVFDSAASVVVRTKDAV